MKISTFDTEVHRSTSGISTGILVPTFFAFAETERGLSFHFQTEESGDITGKIPLRIADLSCIYERYFTVASTSSAVGL